MSHSSFSRRHAHRAAARCLLVLWLGLGTGSIPTIGSACLNESEAPVEEQGIPQDMAIALESVRPANARLSPVTRIITSDRASSAQHAAPLMVVAEDHHRLSRGLAVPLRC